METIVHTSANTLAFDPSGGRYSLAARATPGLGFRHSPVVLEADGRPLSAGEGEMLSLVRALERESSFGPYARVTALYAWAEQGLELELRLDVYREQPFVVVGTRVRNTGEAPVRLGRLTLLAVGEDEAGALDLGPLDERASFFCETGTQRHCWVKRLDADGGEHVSQTIGHLHNPAGEMTLTASFITLDRCKTEVGLRFDGAVRSLTAYCDFDGHELRPGDFVEGEKLMVTLSEDPYLPLEQWADLVQDWYRPRIWAPQPVGWVGWSWKDAFAAVYEEVVLENVRAIRERLAGFGVGYVWVSIGNLYRNLPGYWLRTNEECFPHGLAWLVERLAEAGLELGLWCGLFWISELAEDLVAEFRDVFLRGEDGELLNYYEGRWYYMDRCTQPASAWGGQYILDPTHPRTHAWLRHVFSEYRKLGVRYYMVDFLEAASGSTPGVWRYGELYDTSLIRGPEAYRAAMRVAREAAGDDTYLLGSSGVTLQNVGILDAVRVGPDYGEGRPICPEAGHEVTYHPENWWLHKFAMLQMATHYYTHRKLYVNDSGNVMTVGGVPENEARITTTLFGICGGPVMLGDHLPDLPEDRLALIKSVLPRYTECARPLDLFTSLYPDDSPKLHCLRIERPWGRWSVVAAVNLDEAERCFEVSGEDLGCGGQPLVAWEYWTLTLVADGEDVVSFEVPAHDARVLAVQRRPAHPWVISTDLHVTQGAVELEDVAWDARANRLSGRCVRPAGEQGHVMIYVPSGWEVRDDAPRTVSEGPAGGRVVALKLVFGAEPVEWAVAFEAPPPGGR